MRSTRSVSIANQAWIDIVYDWYHSAFTLLYVAPFFGFIPEHYHTMSLLTSLLVSICGTFGYIVAVRSLSQLLWSSFWKCVKNWIDPSHSMWPVTCNWYMYISNKVDWFIHPCSSHNYWSHSHLLCYLWGLHACVCVRACVFVCVCTLTRLSYTHMHKHYGWSNTCHANCRQLLMCFLTVLGWSAPEVRR